MKATARQTAVRSIATGSNAHGPQGHDAANHPERKLPQLFGSHVFSDTVQRQRLPRPIYRALRCTIETGAELDPGIADAVANAMKDWAVEHGATHYTHWFQPMTGLTAEKHDSFIQQTADGRAILEFSGKELIKGEPDASSFPSGGIRATFEARGYTAWDPTSPAFLRQHSRGGSTLTIPTAFASWTGEALDKKTPLLRSCEALATHATRVSHLIGEKDVTTVWPTAGGEQEYFLIDRRFYYQRPDLLACGRTLFGAPPPKGQQLEDHYFGAITQRVLGFMMDLECELWRLGIPIKTRHNEVAPSQFELAPIFENISIAVDHNMLTMEVLKEVAERHGFYCLLHEKPFDGVNGSGKHLNWSMADNLGNNLLDPGHTPHENLKFILFLTAIIRAVDTHQELLRASIASAGNDHRLGANEAPPAIVSIFVGSQLEEVIRSIIEGRPSQAAASSEMLRLGVNTLPPLPRDISDRNRTSPFAFTGNKFEFRAVGSRHSLAYPGMVLNTIVAESLDYIATELEHRSGSGDRREAIQGLVRQMLAEHQRILFNGDNYSAEWVQEAERRGLANLRDTPAALTAFVKPTSVGTLGRYGVLNQRETEARYDVLTMKYVHRIAVEARSICDLASTSVLPSAIAFQKRLADSITSVAAAAASGGAGAIDTGPQVELLKTTTQEINELKLKTDQLRTVHEEAESTERTSPDLARFFCDRVLPVLNDVRTHIDRLETLVEDEHWPFPKYREMLFVQ